MAELTDIQSSDWQLSLETPGAVVQGLQDITQCIQIILSTQKGSDPLRSEFGTEILRFLDKPINTAIPNLMREMIDAVNQWEPRAKIKKITPQFDKETSEKIKFTVEWKTAFAEGQNIIIYG